MFLGPDAIKERFDTSGEDFSVEPSDDFSCKQAQFK